MNRILLYTFSLLLFVSSFKSSDKKIYDEIKNKSYHPIIPGERNYYKADFREYSTYFDTVYTEINGLKYLLSTTDYGKFKTFAYYREENGNVIYLKKGQTKETIEIPNNPTIGTIWYEGDSTWKYTITSINDIFETSNIMFINCLVIISENVDTKANTNHYQVYEQYYQKGRGYIGTKLGGIVYSSISLED